MGAVVITAVVATVVIMVVVTTAVVITAVVITAVGITVVGITVGITAVVTIAIIMAMADVIGTAGGTLGVARVGFGPLVVGFGPATKAGPCTIQPSLPPGPWCWRPATRVGHQLVVVAPSSLTKDRWKTQGAILSAVIVYLASGR
jgi:hypothetical protein